jgi:uncharacterized membrane protein
LPELTTFVVRTSRREPAVPTLNDVSARAAAEAVFFGRGDVVVGAVVVVFVVVVVLEVVVVRVVVVVLEVVVGGGVVVVT